MNTLARLTVALLATMLVGGVATAPAYAHSDRARGTFYYSTTLGGSQSVEDPVIGVCYSTPALPVGPGESFSNQTNVHVTVFTLSNLCALGAVGPYAPGDSGSAVFLSFRFDRL